MTDGFQVFSSETAWKGITYPRTKLPRMVAVQGQRPPRPRKLPISDALWDLIELCWKQQPSERPTAMEVLNVLGSI